MSTNGASSITFDPRANDRAFDGHAFTISAAEDPPHGQAIVNSGASLTYIPDTGYVGGDTFRYTIADGDSGVASAQIFVNVTPAASANRSPTAVDDTFAVADRASSSVDGKTLLNPTLNDRDPDYDVLTVSSTTTPGHGTATITGGSLVEYVPTTAYSGADSFSYTISDGRGGTETANVALTIANAAPIAANDLITTNRNTSLTFDPRINDVDANGDALTVTTVTSGSHGTTRANHGARVTYTPAPSYVGTDSFLYMLSDGRGGNTSATVAVSILPPSATTLEVMQNDLYAAYATLAGGSFLSATNGVNVYLDRPLTTGKSYWEVKLLCGAIDPGVANIVNVARYYGGYPNKNAGMETYNNHVWTTSEGASGFAAPALNDVYGFALDADARTLKIFKNNTAGPTLNLPFSPPYYPFSGVVIGANLTGQTCATNSAKGEFAFGSGLTAYAPPTGFSHLNGGPNGNIAPIATPDEFGLLTSSWYVFDPIANDIDQNGDALALSSIGSPGHGTAAIVAGNIRYTPTAGYTGSDSFTYVVDDGRGATATGVVTMNMTTPGARIFSISPAVASKTTWNLDTDGPLDLSVAGTWTVVPTNAFLAATKAWGGGGGSWSGFSTGGSGGFGGGTVLLEAGVSYKLYVGGGSGSGYGVGGSNGGANGGYAAGGGGGYSGIRKTTGEPILIAGGGGGGGPSGVGGAGGGATGETAPIGSTAPGGVGGGQTGPVERAYLGERGLTWGSFGPGGGGGGYFGGRAGGIDPDVSGAGGGGGSGFSDTNDVNDAILTTGSTVTPGNSGDANRGGAGASGAPGKVRLQ